MITLAQTREEIQHDKTMIGGVIVAIAYVHSILLQYKNRK